MGFTKFFSRSILSGYTAGMNKEAVIAVIHAAMEAKAIKQAHLAKSLGWSEGNVSRTLSGRHEMSLPTMVKIANALGINVNELVNASLQPTKRKKP